MAKIVLPKICPGDQIRQPDSVWDQIWQPHLVLRDKILLPDLVLGQNVTWLPDSVPLCQMWSYYIGPILGATLCPRTNSGRHVMS